MDFNPSNMRIWKSEYTVYYFFLFFAYLVSWLSLIDNLIVGINTSLNPIKMQNIKINNIPKVIVRTKLIVSKNLKEKKSLNCELISNDRKIRLDPTKVIIMLLNEIQLYRYSVILFKKVFCG